MGDILNSGKRGGKTAGVALGASALYVNGIPFTNTAAKFWSCLFDEVAVASLPDTVIELSASSGGTLSADLLSPATLLQRDLDAIDPATVQAAYADGLAVLELMGPPAGVRLRLLPPGETQPFLDIGLTYMDAEIFPFLLSWLLEWANLPDAAWNEAAVQGMFAAADPARTLSYKVAFDLRTRHLSEGLYHRTLLIRFRREKQEKPDRKPRGPSGS